MTWKHISVLVRAFHDATRGRPAPEDLRTGAAELAIRVHGTERTLTQPALLNLAALALSMPRLTVHVIRAGVPDLVDATDLHALPAEPPRLLQAPWILEVRNPADGERLFGSTASLAGYELDGVRYLIGLGYPDGVMVARWRPVWSGGDLEAGVERGTSPLIDDVDAHKEWAREAARFAVVLGLLLDAAGAPVRVREEGPVLAGRRHGQPRPATPWVTRRISLTESAQRSAAERAGAASTAGIGGRSVARVPVHGHIKRQHFGPGGRETRMIYVASYEARRWVAPKPARVIVTT